MARQRPIEQSHLLQIQAAFEAGYRRCAVEFGHVKPYLSMNEANKKYGRRTVERWIAEGLVTPIKDGTGTSKRRISRDEIETVAFTSNRTSWFENHE